VKVCVVGMGYIGLPTALMMASHGVDVIGVDYNRTLIAQLQKGQMTFEEEGMDELLATARTNSIEFTTEYPAVDLYIVAVPTPYDKETKKIDPTFVIRAVQSVMKVCNKGAVVCIESTVSPGTIDRYVRPVVVENDFVIGEDIHLVHAPERIIPGNMVYELEHNSRTLGADLPEIGEKVRQVYSTFCKGEIVLTDIRTAEMTKVVENTFRDVNIALANELAKICRSDNMDVYEIIRIANKHPRVNILSPGPGVGGHCISVDPWFLVGDYPELSKLISAARHINDSMPEFVLERIYDVMKENGIERLSQVGLYGLTYKENVDDVRESPTLQLLEVLERRHTAGQVQVYDPFIHREMVPNQHFDLDSFLNSVDLVVLLVSHDEIKEHMEKLNGKVVLDTRNICVSGIAYKL